MNIDNWPYPNEKLQYDKGENRRKHSGRYDEARMVFESGNWIGKCPQGFDLSVALKLVQHGIPEFRTTTTEKPCRIWSYHDGVVYVAHSQDGGKTWHGFPNGHPMPEPPRPILRKLEQRAQELGEESRIKKWLSNRWNQ